MYGLAIKKYLEEHGFEALSPKVVLFDMDGVLYDSMPNHAIAWQESMAKFGIHMTADDAYQTEGARGVDTIRQMVRLQQRRDIDEAEAQKMYDVKSQTFHSLPEAPVMPGILSLMRQIHESGIQCGVDTPVVQRNCLQNLETLSKGFQLLRNSFTDIQMRMLPQFCQSVPAWQLKRPGLHQSLSRLE